jgi:aldose 1-epimerase
MITKRPFGTLEDGTAVSLWELTNERGLTAQVLDYGVTIRSVLVPDKRGKLVDVVLGYDTLKEYVRDGCYLGTTVGRCANRIKGASFELNGKTYPLYANNGENHLHGGKRGFNKYVWHGEQTGEAVTFSRLSPDGEEGYPGNLQVQVTIGWEGDSLTIRYEATTDQDTVVNLTNHSYFNLNGKGKINGHLLQVAADHYTLNGRDGIPTGEVVSVEGSAMDFRTPKTIGQDAGKKEPCVSFFNGYDSNFIVSGHPFATAVGYKTGITLIADTDQPGVQLYTANALGPRLGK